MKPRLKSSITVLLLIAVCVVNSSAKKKPKTPPDPMFMAIQNISILPVVDARAGKKASVNLGKLQGSLAKTLKRKRYPVVAAGSTGEAGEIAIEDMQAADPAYIKKLGPPDERWVLVVFLEDITSKITFGSTGNAELTGYLFDKEEGKLIWQNKGIGQSGQGGLIGMTMKGMMKGAALDNAVLSLLGSIPRRPKPGK